MACNRWPEVCGTSSYARLQASLGMADASTASEQERRHPADRLKNDLTKRQTNSRESLKNLESHNEHCEWVSCRENRRLIEINSLQQGCAGLPATCCVALGIVCHS